MPETCHRSGKNIYPADNPIRVAGLSFLPQHFTCKATGTRLSLKTYVAAEGDVYLKGKEPVKKPTPTASVVDDRVAAVPDSAMRTTDRMFNVAGKGQNRGAAGGQDAGSSYGDAALGVQTAVAAPKPPTTVDNINLQEKLHNGVSVYTRAEGEATD